MSRAHEQLLRSLSKLIPAHRLITDPLRRRAWATDASFYYLIPELVVMVETEQEVAALLSACKRHGTPVTFRAAGTSLSGQAISDSVLAVLGDGWRQIRVLDQGRRVALGPAVRGGRANEHLAPLGRKLGPDPASIASAMIGGIAANNSSGMCCGTARNSYQTVSSLRMILADGKVVDTGDARQVERFRTSHAEMLAELRRLGEETRADLRLAARIRRKYQIKNTTGYSLNALVDFEDPVDILEHLMIGSEGTLGFIAEVCYETVPEDPHKATALVFFDRARHAAEAVMGLRSLDVSAVELIDRTGLRSAVGRKAMPGFIADLGPDASALLIEVTGQTPSERDRRAEAAIDGLDGATTLRPPRFETDPAVRDAYWAMRKDLYPRVGALREIGTTVIIEDVAFPPDRLADAVEDLQSLFRTHGYQDAVIFGHARDGNLHFCFAQDLSTRSEVLRFARFMDGMAQLVVDGYDGSLKAEHGTGRNIAPFVEREWGEQAFALMRRIKDLLDPDGILNPGVILNEDRSAHVRNLKPMPRIDDIVDRCTECGFCESHCPSRGLTLSPRQRIVGARRRHPSTEDPQTRASLDDLYVYHGLDTCAACGLCAGACPVGIDTGAFIKQERGKVASPLTRRLGDHAAKNFEEALGAARFGLRAAQFARGLLGPDTLDAVAGAARTLSGGASPRIPPTLPTAYRFRPSASPDDGRPSLVYLPSCLSRTLRAASGEVDRDPLPEVVQRLLDRAGYRVVFPDRIDELCCGLSFESKGLPGPADAKAREAAAAIRDASGGSDPIVLCDTSPCSHRLAAMEGLGIEVLDLTDLLHDHLLPRLPIRRRERRVAVHSTCSNRRMQQSGKLVSIARACATEVVVPELVECCGFAGDRGLTHPELNAHALRDLRVQLEGVDAAYSTALSCEIGLSEHGGLPYRSIAYLVEESCAD